MHPRRPADREQAAPRGSIFLHPSDARCLRIVPSFWTMRQMRQGKNDGGLSPEASTGESFRQKERQRPLLPSDFKNAYKSTISTSESLSIKPVGIKDTSVRRFDSIR